MNNDHMSASDISRKPIVIVIDDDENIGRIFEIGWHQEDTDLLYFSSALQALDWAADTTPTLAIIDITMPEMDGIELCQILRNRANTRQLPIILLSAIDKAELQRLATLVGAMTCVSKPFAPKQVFALIRTCLQQGHC